MNTGRHWYRLRVFLEPLVWDLLPYWERSVSYQNDRVWKITSLKFRWLCVVVHWWKE